MSVPRAIRMAFLATEQSEGVGARVRRSIGTPRLPNLTPFLMLDHFNVQSPAGFPDHPHIGMETCTLLLSGAFLHQDFNGGKGTIRAGDLQFMTAGRGIVHAEMPYDNGDGSPNTGLQLWIDLPKELKYCEPRYRDLRASEIPSVEVDDGKVSVKVISGKSHGVDSVRDLAYTPVWMLDITIRPGGKITQELPKDWTAFAYTLSGAVTLSDGADPNKSQTITPYHNVVFENDGKADVVIASVEEGAVDEAHFMLFAGTPLDQPIVQYGPFVLNDKEGIMQAMRDYQSHSNGFERAKDWESEIGKRMVH